MHERRTTKQNIKLMYRSYNNRSLFPCNCWQWIASSVAFQCGYTALWLNNIQFSLCLFVQCSWHWFMSLNSYRLSWWHILIIEKAPNEILLSKKYLYCSFICKLMQRSAYNMWRFSVINWIDTNSAATSYTTFIITSAISIVIAFGCAVCIV